MQTSKKRPLGVTLIALIYLWIGCGGALFFPVIAFTGGTSGLWQIVAGNTIHSEAGLRISGYLFAMIWYSAYVAYAIAGFGLWKLRNWAREFVIGINLFFGSVGIIVALCFSRPLPLAIPTLIAALVPLAWTVWYLRRPRVRFAFGDLQLSEGTDPESLPGGLTRTGIAWLVGGVVSAFALFFICVFALVESMIHLSGGYKLALANANKSPCAVKALGSPITAGWLISGSTNETGSDGTANLTIPVKGPKGKGSLEVESKKADGTWEIESLQLSTDSDQIQLVPANSPCQ